MARARAEPRGADAAGNGQIEPPAGVSAHPPPVAGMPAGFQPPGDDRRVTESAGAAMASTNPAAPVDLRRIGQPS